ncbi:hypothetical protein FDUTEX481_00987 [Tolypothrix sp. PCC 7601]|nr:hypothetical protein FDUTEX481_00987 [Tolypothrix sp. PCC 7601]
MIAEITGVTREQGNSDSKEGIKLYLASQQSNMHPISPIAIT